MAIEIYTVQFFQGQQYVAMVVDFSKILKLANISANFYNDKSAIASDYGV